MKEYESESKKEKVGAKKREDKRKKRESEQKMNGERS